jgi:hypothetical protein
MTRLTAIAQHSDARDVAPQEAHLVEAANGTLGLVATEGSLVFVITTGYCVVAGTVAKNDIDVTTLLAASRVTEFHLTVWPRVGEPRGFVYSYTLISDLMAMNRSPALEGWQN